MPAPTEESGGAAGGIRCGSGKGGEIWGAVFASAGSREWLVKSRANPT